jgi:hypothetical protein
MKRTIFLLAAALTLAGCAKIGTPQAAVTTETTTATPPPEPDNPSPPPGTPVASLDEAAKVVGFALITPKALPSDATIAVYVAPAMSEADAVANSSVRITYIDPTFGTYTLSEKPQGALTQDDLEGLVARYSVDPSSEANLSMVALAEGTDAMLIEPKDPKVSQAPASIEWIRDGLALTIFNPSALLASDAMTQLANDV